MVKKKLYFHFLNNFFKVPNTAKMGGNLGQVSDTDVSYFYSTQNKFNSYSSSTGGNVGVYMRTTTVNENLDLYFSSCQNVFSDSNNHGFFIFLNDYKNKNFILKILGGNIESVVVSGGKIFEQIPINIFTFLIFV